jgi:hypothetical protein
LNMQTTAAQAKQKQQLAKSAPNGKAH